MTETVEFNCANCNNLIAFDSKYAGKRARCLNCGQLFIIPSESFAKPEIIKTKTEEEKGDPIPGFWRAVFIDNWKVFVDYENLTVLVFVIAAVTFKFFLGRAICGMSFVSHVVIWGWLLGFYLNIIYETAFEIDQLPKIYLGTSVTFIWYIIKPFLIFSFILFVVLLPFFIATKLLMNRISIGEMWQHYTGFYLLLQIFFIVGLFFFPVAILTATIGQDIAMLRPDYILKPAFKAFGPYIVVVVMLVAACVLEMQTTQFDWQGYVSKTTHATRLILNFAVQVIAIISMRSIGLFYRHYKCYLPW